VSKFTVASADNLNSFATISGSRKKVFILFLRGTVRAGIASQQIASGKRLGSTRAFLIRLRQVAAWQIYALALILDYVSAALGAVSPRGSLRRLDGITVAESASESQVRDTRESRLGH
jgi:hypothetical protein